MQVPAPEDFKHEDGAWVGPPWWAPIPGMDFDLFVSDGNDGPDAESLAFAQRVLPLLDELRAVAARYLARVMQVSWIPRMDAENAELISVFCDAGSKTVILEMVWDPDTDHLWWVELFDNGSLGIRPVALGMRGWNSQSRPPWRAPHRTMNA